MIEDQQMNKKFDESISNIYSKSRGRKIKQFIALISDQELLIQLKIPAYYILKEKVIIQESLE